MKITTSLILVVFVGCLLTSCNGLRSGNAPATDNTRLEQIETMYAEYREDFPDVKEISPQGVADRQKSGDLVLVDVRTQEEQAVSMLPGAITAEAFAAAEETYRDKAVITYCTIGARSGVYADELRQKGFDVCNLKGSLLAWTHAGLPLKDAAGQDTKRVHVYGKTWDLAAEGYEAVW
jgi:rhodanese-related sulfurtransferase